MSMMRREIEESIQVAERLVARRAELEAIGARLAELRPAVVVVAGRGTSDHAAVFARYLLEYVLETPVALAAPSLLTQYGVQSGSPRSALVAFSQSGAGPDIVALTREARGAGALTIAVTNSPDSELAAAAAHLIDLDAGPEQAVAATKTYVAELVAVVLIASGAARALGRGNEWLSTIEGIPAEMGAALAETDAWIAATYPDSAVQAMHRADRVLVATRGFQYPNALEFALKLRETTGVFADGFSAADLLHGPIASANSETPTVIIDTDLITSPSLAPIGDRLRESGVPLLRISSNGTPSAALLPLAVRGGPAGVASTAVALLALVESIAVARGQNPDAPAGLSKVTKTL